MIATSGSKIARPKIARPKHVLARDPRREPMPDRSPAWRWHRVLELWIPADRPVAKGNSKHAFVVRGRPMVACGKAAVRHERLLTRALRLALPEGWAPLVGAVRLDVRVDLEVPDLSKEHPLSWRVRALRGDLAAGPHETGPDRGNLLKMIEDCAKGTLFADDAQVLDGLASKRWSTSPGWFVRLWRPVGARGGAEQLQALDDVLAGTP